MANITGWTGNDTISGSTGADSMAGWGGNDSITANTGNDTAYGGAGNDTIRGADGNDLIYGDRDQANTWGYRVYDRNFTSANNQAFNIESGTLRGSGITSAFDVQSLALAARGTSGNPEDFGIILTSTFTATTAGTYRFATTSDDGSTLRLLNSRGNALNFSNQSGGTLAYMNNDFHQSATTRYGDVTLAAGQSYTIEIRYWENEGGNTLGATVTPPGGTATNLLGSSYIGSGTNTGNDSLFGDTGNDTLWGEAGNDSLYGGNDADLLYGGTGNDLLYGGTGEDTLFGGDGNDTLYGDAGNDSLEGDAGNDRLFGGADNDTLSGGQGRDSLSGDAGNDIIYGGTEEDTLLGGDGNDVLYGESGADSLSGDAGNDSLFGGDGDDSLFGGTGNDTLYGGTGQDVLFGGDDEDVFIADAGSIGDSIDGSEGGSDNDTLDLRYWGKSLTNIIYGGGNNESGTVQFLDSFGAVLGTMNFANIENVIPCFTPGSKILTARGEVPVETIRVGDQVVTQDHGLQTVRWAGHRRLAGWELAVQPDLNPVLIRQGALGHGLPLRDMMVSPQHRMLFSGMQAELLFGEAEVLVAATHLRLLDGVETASPDLGVTYIHLMFDSHEIICVDGAWTESFQPGDQTLSGLNSAQRNEVLTLFPALKSLPAKHYPAARITLKSHEARVLLAA